MKSLFLAITVLALACGLYWTAAGAVIRVDPGAQGDGSGTSWSNARTNLAAALGSAVAGDELWVRAGDHRAPSPTSFEPRYIPRIIEDSQIDAAFLIPAGVSVCGGFSGNETARDQRNPRNLPTRLFASTLDGGRVHSRVLCRGPARWFHAASSRTVSTGRTSGPWICSSSRPEATTSRSLRDHPRSISDQTTSSRI